MKHLVTFLALALYAGTSINAQTTGSATIVGTVTDTTGVVVPGVKINVVNTETNFHFESVTNQDGYYYVPYLRPGTYNLAVEAAGFKKYVRDSCALMTRLVSMSNSNLAVLPKRWKCRE
jgi:hypothetical protein